MTNENSLKVGSNEMELVDFRILKQDGSEIYEGVYGINVSKVREIIKMPSLTELPGTPEFIEGIFDLRDVVIPVVNLSKWMGIQAPEEAQKISQQTLKGLGLEGFEDRITHKLSGGEKKLVALATILSMQPKLLLLDEPSNNLDPATRERLITILRDLQQAHIIISHDLDFLTSTCSRLYTISDKQLTACKEKQVHSHEHIHPYGNQPHQHGT